MTKEDGAPPIEQALEWLACRNGGAMSIAERRAFDAWLATGPENAAAYAEAEALWASLDWSETLNSDSLQRASSAVLPLERPVKQRAPSLRLSRRGFAALAAGLGAAALTPLAVTLAADNRRRFVTEVGEIRHLALEDGSRVSLGGQSRLTTRIGDGVRKLRLDGGEAYFDVARDESRVFIVIGEGLKAEALGTIFEVRLTDLGPEVFVEEGRVRVTEMATGRQLIAAAGEWASLRDGVLTKGVITSATVAPWRRQRFSFIDQPLAEVVGELNRYYRPGIRIITPELRQRKVTAAFTIEQIPQALESLAQEMNGRLVRRSGPNGEIEIVLKS